MFALKKIQSAQMLRNFSTTNQNRIKVCVVGASGGIGQPLSLLLKMNKSIKCLSLYDIVHTPGVAADLSHIDTPAKVCGYMGQEQLADALECADIVTIPAGMPRKPGMTRDDLFNKNADVVRDISGCIAEVCPKALIAIITNPVNSVVPLAATILKKAGVYDPKRLFGVPTLDKVRSHTFIGEALNLDPAKIKVQCICGHSGITIIPVISQCNPPYKADEATIAKLTARIQEAGTEVVKAKAGAGSATLSMAYSGAVFINNMIRGLKGEECVVETAFVESKLTDSPFFASELVFGKDGIKCFQELPKLNDFEKKMLDKAMPELKKNIQKGIDYVSKPKC